MLVLVLPHYSYSTFINVVTAEEADWTAKPPYRGGMLLELLGVIYKYVSAIISISHDNIVLTRVNAGIWWGKKYEGTVDEVYLEEEMESDHTCMLLQQSGRSKLMLTTPSLACNLFSLTNKFSYPVGLFRTCMSAWPHMILTTSDIFLSADPNNWLGENKVIIVIMMGQCRGVKPRELWYRKHCYHKEHKFVAWVTSVAFCCCFVIS